jgi:hypothetical protein
MQGKWSVMGTHTDGRTRWAMAGLSVWKDTHEAALSEASVLNDYSRRSLPGDKLDMNSWTWSVQPAP